MRGLRINKAFLFFSAVILLAANAAWAVKSPDFFYSRQKELISENKYKMGPIRWCQALLAGIRPEVQSVFEDAIESAPGAFPQAVERAYAGLSRYGSPVESTLDLVLADPNANAESLESVSQILLHSRSIGNLPERVQKLLTHAQHFNSLTLTWISLVLIRPEFPLEKVAEVYTALLNLPLASLKDQDGLSFLSESPYGIEKLFLYKPGAAKLGVDLLREVLNRPGMQFWWLRYVSGTLRRMVIGRYVGFGRRSLKGLGFEELLQEFDAQFNRLHASLNAKERESLAGTFKEISKDLASVRLVLPH